VTYREPDLVVSVLDVGLNPIEAGQTSRMTFTVKTRAIAPREAAWFDRLCTSADPPLD
jgi:hypothetical protein